jgi:hypothetical protein
MSVSPPERLLERIRAEYLEMPGLCLTSGQMQPTMCARFARGRR